MQSKTAITVDHISKVYKLYPRPVDRLKEALTPFKKSYHTEFTALNGISLTIEKGETVGIIGRNGSGKSTLLQIISGVLKPTSGGVRLNGRISALLELGAGFNPEFTGKQNVYINMAILGLGKKEIESIYPKVVEFAEIGDFINHPVKVYSSGMYVRLAFAVAINVNPEILVVDEALAVGDTLFQAKCYEKFREFQKKGITILFVTHALDMITSTCTSAYLLNHGSIISEGAPKKVVDDYNRFLSQENIQNVRIDHSAGSIPQDDNWQQAFHINRNESRYGNRRAEIVDAGIFSESGEPTQVLVKGEVYLFCMKIRFHEAVKRPIYAYSIKHVKGFDISGSNTKYHKIETKNAKPGDLVMVTFSQRVVLNSGGYMLAFGCTGFEDGEFVVYERRYDCMAFDVVSERAGVGFLDLDSKISITKLASS